MKDERVVRRQDERAHLAVKDGEISIERCCCCIVDPEGCSMHRRSVCKFVEDEEFRRLTRAIKRWTDVDAESNDLGRHS